MRTGLSENPFMGPFSKRVPPLPSVFFLWLGNHPLINISSSANIIITFLDPRLNAYKSTHNQSILQTSDTHNFLSFNITYLYYTSHVVYSDFRSFRSKSSWHSAKCNEDGDKVEGGEVCDMVTEVANRNPSSIIWLLFSYGNSRKLTEQQ